MFTWKKKHEETWARARLTPTEAPVAEALILICEKCGKKLDSDPERNPSRRLQQALKEEIKSAGLRGSCRAVLTSCMDACPKDEITVAISRPDGPDRFFSLQGEGGSEASAMILDIARQR